MKTAAVSELKAHLSEYLNGAREGKCMKKTVVLLILLFVSCFAWASYTHAFILITQEESQMEEALLEHVPFTAKHPGFSDRETGKSLIAVPEANAGGPEISVLSPDSDKTNLSPLKIMVKFTPREGSHVDLSTLRVELLKLFTINITDRLKEYTNSRGINVEKAELPSGNYKIRVILGDTNGGITSKVFALKVQ